MIVLKEQEAIAYLDRVDKCLSTKIDTRTDIQILLTMTQMQRAYLQTLTGEEDPKNLASLNIASSGFPELPSWLGDIRRANSKFESLRQRRVTAFLPVLQDVASSGTTVSSEGLSAQLNEESVLTDAFGKERGKREQEFLKNIFEGNTGNIKDDINYPGFLNLRFRYESSARGISIVKYIDDDKEPGGALIRFRDSGNQKTISELEHEKNEAKNYVNCGVFGRNDWDEQVSNLRYPLRRHLLCGDYSDEDTDGFEVALSEVYHFETLLQILNQLSSSLLRGESLNSSAYINQIQDTNSQLKSAIASASSAELKDLFDKCLTSEVKVLSAESQDISVGATGVIVRTFDRESYLGRAWRFLHRW
ncbi:hypothetical protein A3C59_00050 [Candidatus Daviesbacteria bacterium RIFCSPHIGHO2_02_FULL_36_13]|uniref:Uncharacterized protein n=1 Tax=Candidatus Daviesbacteria bacterium RIFCSPHIGHO2_02_FULL_36_13 TaxID=1797768 RepID=A0A1F5JYK8_9BACT|nr:MAG: hypothetical protein A3C59_00050 [Candidatus Daviesbacteria bacterium RIFCSPHIGHO2_02_FULL_36_13]OGE40881.1 MAG: hypothetical protein A3A45_01355 [Candidatus Daviesbacteria bacterium RIFCSPLOWO2_01_FULL_36_8]